MVKIVWTDQAIQDLTDIVPEYRLASLRELIRGNYRLVYRIVDKLRIDILLVHHSARALKIPRSSRKKR